MGGSGGCSDDKLLSRTIPGPRLTAVHLFFFFFLQPIVWCAGFHVFVFRPIAEVAVGVAWPNHLSLLYLQCVPLSRSLWPQSSSLLSL